MKRYDQYCPMAHALDLVGERWALLVVRELMKGPRRYTDLAEALPGMAGCAQATGDLEAAAGHLAEAITIAAPRALIPAQATALAARARLRAAQADHDAMTAQRLVRAALLGA